MWCLADSESKFVSNFEIYRGKNPTSIGEAIAYRSIWRGEIGSQYSITVVRK